MRLPALALALSLLAAPVAAQSAPCGGDFGAFVNGLRQEAASRGLPQASIDSFFRGVARDPAVISRDRGQGVFRLPFTEFARRVISQSRLVNGQRNAERHGAILARAEREFGIPPAILLAFWALETDYGAVQGDFNTRNALVTLAHDCRRPGLFRPHIFAAIALHARGDFDPQTMTGAWAGEIGMVQKLPLDILELGIDGDGDGRIDLKNSVADALLSGANMLRAKGWRAGQPWLIEVSVPERMDWSRSGTATRLPVSEWQAMGVRARAGRMPSGGLRASLILPEGHRGPAFLGFDNYHTLFEWNQSFVYVTTAAYFATRLAGAPVFDPRNPTPMLSLDDMRELQRRLSERGHDVGGIDGILGAMTRAAVQREQNRLGLPADGWPTPELLRRL